MIRIAFALALALVAAPGVAQRSALGAEAGIDYAANGGIRDYHAESERVIYLRDRTNRWYKATFVGVCPNLRTSDVIAFDTDGLGRLDRSGAVLTRSGRCQFDSLVRAAPPRGKGKS